MRVGFAGTPAFAAQALNAILAAGFEVPLVLTRPDRPKGRGLVAEPSPVKRLAGERRLAVLQPATLKADEARAPLLAVPLDVLVVAAYGLILPPAVLSWPRYGCLNIHASALPRWRGAAPIQRAIAAGDTATGVTIMQMDAGLDTGAMVELVPVPIDAARNRGDAARQAGGRRGRRSGGRLGAPGARRVAERDAAARDGATYAAKVDRADAVIDWSGSADAIDRQVRAFDPVPGATTHFVALALKVWRAEPVAGANGVPAGHSTSHKQGRHRRGLRQGARCA